MIETRTLGREGLEVSALGLGCMGMSQSYGTPDDAESVATIHRALDLGCNLFDTAESYGPFTNEQLLGRALRGRRDQAIIATKFGWDFSTGRRGELNSRPEHIRSVVEQSLQQLSTDYIDVLYQHRVDLRVPIEDVAGTVSELVRAGKVRYFGLSEAGVNTIRRAHTVHPVSALQTEYSVWERHIEADILPTLRELGIGLVGYAPLGRGFLTGTPRRAEDYPETDYRRQDPRFQAGNYDTNITAARHLTQLATSKNITPAQLALAWLLHQGPDIVPIPGTKRRVTLQENLVAASINLHADDIARIDDILPTGQVAGTRYAPEAMHVNNR